jgi:hypothetical protein
MTTRLPENPIIFGIATLDCGWDQLVNMGLNVKKGKNEKIIVKWDSFEEFLLNWVKSGTQLILYLRG